MGNPSLPTPYQDIPIPLSSSLSLNFFPAVPELTADDSPAICRSRPSWAPWSVLGGAPHWGDHHDNSNWKEEFPEAGTSLFPFPIVHQSSS
jgi:hypothetical protein